MGRRPCFIIEHGIQTSNTTINVLYIQHIQVLLFFHKGSRRLEGQVAIITGGSNGIGAATARKFVAEGAYVYIADIDVAAGMELCKELRGGASFVKCDVAEEADVKAVVDLAAEEKGHVDIMLNNAGMLHAHGNAIADVQLDTWDRVMAVTVTGSMLGMKHAARVMVPRRRGCILFTSSVLGMVATNNSSYAYVAAKNAVVGLVKRGAVELAKAGIRVNAVSPYAIATKMLVEWADEVSNGMCSKEFLEAELAKQATFKGKALTVDDVANSFVFLASEESAYVSGHNLILDGGYSLQGREIIDSI